MNFRFPHNQRVVNPNDTRVINLQGKVAAIIKQQAILKAKNLMIEKRLASSENRS